MKTRCTRKWLVGPSVLVLLGWSSLVSAQTFTSGSTGALGDLTPTANRAVTLPSDGVLNYGIVNIPAGVTVTFVKNAANTPVTMLATGNVTIAGTLSVDGENGRYPIQSLDSNPPGEGGPGGARGGFSGAANNNIAPGNGQGVNGGVWPALGCAASCFDTGGAGTYGGQTDFLSLLPLFGGSGGSGTVVVDATHTGNSGGGGGGAIVIASSTQITLAAGSLVTARGGSGPVRVSGVTPFCRLDGGAGSGGAIRLVAPAITGTGTLRVAGGLMQCGPTGGPGRIRVEAFSFTGFNPVLDPPIGTSPPVYSQVTTLGPVTATSNPALTGLPTLAITSVGSVAPPALPLASYTTADISLPQGTPAAQPLVISASNVPVGTAFIVRMIPKNGTQTSLATGPSTGTLANSSVSVTMTFPSGQVVVLTAFANFTLPQLAGLFPLLDGDPAEQILVAATDGAPSTVSVVTKSGKQVPVSRLSQADQIKLAMVFEAMRNAN